MKDKNLIALSKELGTLCNPVIPPYPDEERVFQIKSILYEHKILRLVKDYEYEHKILRLVKDYDEDTASCKDEILDNVVYFDDSTTLGAKCLSIYSVSINKVL